jgi:hypothetical protein
LASSVLAWLIYLPTALIQQTDLQTYFRDGENFCFEIFLPTYYMTRCHNPWTQNVNIPCNAMSNRTVHCRSCHIFWWDAIGTQ